MLLLPKMLILSIQLLLVPEANLTIFTFTPTLNLPAFVGRWAKRSSKVDTTDEQP